MTGLVVGLEANRPTVLSDEGTRYLCYLRGRIQHHQGRIMVGDRVDFDPTDPGEAMITSVHARHNMLLRPPVSNVTGLFVVFTVVAPDGNRELLDKRLVLAELSSMRAEVIINKTDLITASEVEALARVYRNVGYPVWTISAERTSDVIAMMQAPREGIWVLVGESGSGKSTILGQAIPGSDSTTQGLSRIGRGKETTRRVGLWWFETYWLADAPGYTSLKTLVDDEREIRESFPEFGLVTCRYSDCRHLQEPQCGVRAAVADGGVDVLRYRHYQTILAEWVRTR